MENSKVQASYTANEDGWFCAALIVSNGTKQAKVLIPGDAGRPFRSKATATKYAKEALEQFSHDPRFAKRMASEYL